MAVVLVANAKDCRPVETVLDAAAERIGKPRQPHVARSLETHDVQWAWQLTELTDANWESWTCRSGCRRRYALSLPIRL